MELPTSLVHALQDQADLLGDRPALWTHRGEGPVPTSWRSYARRVRHAALGLLSLGLAPGEVVALVSGSREESLVLELAVMAAGGVPLSLHPADRPEQLRAQLALTRAALLCVERPEQAQLAGKARAGRPRRVVVLEGTGPLPRGALAFADVLARGEASDEAPYWERVNSLRPEGLGRLVFTAGTTGEPRPVMLSHRGLVWTAHKLCQTLALDERERFLSFLPRAHLGEQLCSLQLPLVLGAQVHFAPPGAGLADALVEVRPSVVLAPPAVWEGFQGRLEEELRELPPRLQEGVRWARRTAVQWHARDLEGEPLPTSLQLQQALARRLVFDPLRARLGLDRAHLLASWGPLGRESLDSLLSLDLVVRELYGLVEAGGPVAVSTAEHTRPGRQGRAMLGVELRVAPDGELLVRSDGTALGYWEDAAASEALVRDGWLHTGDAGDLDDEGYLCLAGRMRELVVTPSGRRIAPARLEGLLRALPLVSQAVVLGERSHSLVALVTLVPEQVRELCTPREWPTDPAVLATHPEFLASLEEQVAVQVNRRVSRAEAIKRVGVLPEPLSVERGELTAAGDVRRAAVAARHHALVKALQAEAATGRPRTAAG